MVSDSDRRLLPAYRYLHATAYNVLNGMLSKPDWKHIKIIAWKNAKLNGDFMSTESIDGFLVVLAECE